MSINPLQEERLSGPGSLLAAPSPSAEVAPKHDAYATESPRHVSAATRRRRVPLSFAFLLPVSLSRSLPFGLVLGSTVAYLTVIVALPLFVLFGEAFELSWTDVWRTIGTPRVRAALVLTFSTALAAALVNTVFGLIVAWVLARYRFVGRRFLDAIVDLPFALPTAVAGIALTAIFAPNGWLGAPLARQGINVAFTPLGITVALVFIGLPFVVRTVQPVLEDFDPAVEEAAACLGASRARTFGKVIMPTIGPALLAGFGMALARGLGEYGSIVFISGNMPMKTEIMSLLIVTKLEQYDYAGATALAAVMLVLSFGLLLGVNLLQWRQRRYSVEQHRGAD